MAVNAHIVQDKTSDGSVVTLPNGMVAEAVVVADPNGLLPGDAGYTGIGGTGGGGGAATVADGADVAEGATTDVAVTTDANGTVSAKLRGLVKILADVWDSVNHRVKVDGSAVTQPVSATALPLPTGAATAAKQAALGTAGSSSTDVISVQGIASGTALKVDGSAVTQPVSAASLPLPTGAATAAKQAALGTAGSSSTDVISVQGIASGTAQPISAASLPLPTGAATAAKQPALGTAGASSTDVISVQGIASGTAQPVSGTVAVSNLAQIAGSAPLMVTPGDGLSVAFGALYVAALSQVYNGANFVLQRTPNVFKAFNALSIASEATIWTPAAGKKFRVLGCVLTASVAGNIVIKDNTAGTIILVIPSTAGGPGTCLRLGNGILSAAANNVLTATGPSASTLSGVVFGCEE